MSANPQTTLLGTIAALQMKREDEEQAEKDRLEETRKAQKYEQSKILDGGYTSFEDWNSVERPRTTDFGARDNQYLSALAISGDDYLRFQARLNPNPKFTSAVVKPQE